MLNRMRGSTDKITDFQVGSVARTLIEGPATEIDQLYQQMFIGLREAIPVATFLSFGFDLLPSGTANGTVTVSRSAAVTQPLTIQAGTVFTAGDGRRYLSVADVVWPAASLSVDVSVRAETAGLSGNAASGVVSASEFFLNGEVITSGPMVNGRDQETDVEREARFADFVASLSRGTVAAVTYAASISTVSAGGVATEYVTVVGVDENPGIVRLYLYSSTGLPSAALLADAQRRIDGYRDDAFGVIVPGFRSAGVRVDVLPAQEVTVNFSAQVKMFGGYTLDTATVNALRDVFSAVVTGVKSGETLYIGTLVERMLTVPGVEKVVPSNNANVACGASQVLKAGAFTVTALNG